MLNEAFLTGCDEKTDWMLEWWFTEYSKHNSIPVIFADFGVSDEMREYVEKNFAHVIKLNSHKDKAWFLKPQSMINASKLAKKVCWIDTDCHVLRSIPSLIIL